MWESIPLITKALPPGTTLFYVLDVRRSSQQVQMTLTHTVTPFRNNCFGPQENCLYLELF